MVRGVGLNNVIQLSEDKTEESVQTLTFKAADPGFNETIGDGCLVGSQNDTAIGPAEELIESLGELAVTVMDKESDINSFLLGPHPNVPSLLLHPLIVRVVGTWGEKDLSAAKMYKG